MPFSDCVRLLTPLMMEGLAKVHERGLIHGDISPDHIMVRPDGGAELLDLGAAGDMSVNRGSRSQPATRNGFRSPERYTEAGQVGPWTDIYALCATIYSCVTGQALPSAPDRMNHPEIDFPADRKEALPVSARNALKDGLAVDPEKRIREMGGLNLRGLYDIKPDLSYSFGYGYGVVITGYTGYRDNFEIPSELGGRPVVGIGDEAFYESRISEIAIPGSVRRIGVGAFDSCENLTFVGLAEGPEEIGALAFVRCGSLTQLEVPESVSVIGEQVFWDTGLTEITVSSDCKLPIIPGRKELTVNCY